MQFIDISTEQTTAFTDLILAIVSALGVIWIFKTGHRIDRQKTNIWSIAFIFLSLSAVLGAVAHGLKMPVEVNRLLWHPLNLFLGLCVAFFAIGVVYDFKQFKIKKIVVIFILVVSIVFFGVTVLIPGLFIIFIIYEAIAMLFALTAYFLLFIKKKLYAANFMTVGILFSIIAAIVQSIKSFRINLIWEFDHNGLFHLIQIIGLLFLFSGLVKELRSRKIKIN